MSDGLRRILFVEVSHNKLSLEFVGSFWHGDKLISLAGTGAGETLMAEAWEDTRVKLSQHLLSKEFVTFVSYYANLLRMKENLGEKHPNAKPQPFKIDATLGWRRRTW